MNLKIIIVLVFFVSLFIGCDMESKKVSSQKIILSNCNYNQDSIILKLKSELEVEEIRKNFSILTQNMIAVLEKSKLDSTIFFPYNNIDSVVLLTIENDKILQSKMLENEKICSLIELLNNPLYYQWGECGTPVPEYSVLFYLKEKQIAKIDISCENAFIECQPQNNLLRNGGLNNIGKTMLKSIMGN